jgi:hypothetical protein
VALSRPTVNRGAVQKGLGPMIYGIKSLNQGHANTKIRFRGYEISIAMDDSCGKLRQLSRTEIAVFRDDKEVSSEFRHASGDAENLFLLMKSIDELTKE